MLLSPSSSRLLAPRLPRLSALQGCELAGGMAVQRLLNAEDSPTGVEVPVRGRSVSLLGSVAALLHALLVHDVGLAAQAGLAGRKGSDGISVLPRKQPKVGRRGGRFNWELRVWGNHGVDGLVLVFQRLC